jgi:hypothetical protein
MKRVASMINPSITTNHTAVHGTWTAEVTRLQASLGRITAQRESNNPCLVSFFEVPGDRDLHVNVIHRRETVSVKGWSGPAAVPDGFVLNRRFRTRGGILEHVREVLFAEPA